MNERTNERTNEHIIEGVTPGVLAKMQAAGGNILREDGLIQRECAHGVRHPVGDIHREFVGAMTLDDHRKSRCCPERCCETWNVRSDR